ncbi:MAG TPA: response regulator transcription factor [Pyrinomonadaceae bacterium]|nr:response regulator transcription factor [Pyrinomonadaceae bacterium]
MARARILLADDHKEMRDRVARVLENEFEVLEAVTDGQALLEAASELKPDLCLLDISMPVMNGFEAANQLRESGSKAKIVFLSIHEDRDFVREAFKAGASAYVIKRRMARDLCTAVREALAGRTFISGIPNGELE